MTKPTNWLHLQNVPQGMNPMTKTIEINVPKPGDKLPFVVAEVSE